MEWLLEREAELATLDEVVGGAVEARGSTVLVAGEAGTGKTSLIRALRARAADRVCVLVGRCEPLSVPMPLGPLREIAEEAGAADLLEAEGGDRMVLARALTQALMRRAPTVAVVEDAHWADPMTLDVLRLLSRRIEDRRIALAVTYRDDEEAANPDLGQLLGALATNPSTRRVTLGPLSEDAIRRLAGPAGVDPGRLLRITGGNPFLVVEAIAAGDGIPATVRHATLARVGRLSPAARGVVDAAAVIGQQVRPSVLEAVVPGSMLAVEEALARGVVVAQGDALGFRHELIRDAIEASIPPPRRAALHAGALSALAREAGPGDAARLAHHAEAAGMAAEACRYASRAADEAGRIGALREMGLQTQRALRLGAGLEAGERYELLLRYSRAANFASTRPEDAVGPAEEALAIADRLRDPARQGRALVALAWALWSLDRLTEAKAAVERAVSLLEPAGETGELARAHAARIRMEATAFDPAAALAAGPRALALAARSGLDETRMDVAISVALARGHRGDPAALAALEGEGRAARGAGLAIQAVRTSVNRVFVAMILRRHAVVDAAAREALALFDDFQTPIPAQAVEVFRARSLLDRGRWDEARAIAARPGSNRAGEAPIALVIDGLVGVRRGEPDAARLLERAWEEIAGVPESSRHAAVRVALIESAWLRGDVDGAREQIHRARESAAVARFARPAAELALWAHRCGLRAGTPPRAPAPVLLELAGDWRAAIRAWTDLDAPFEAALAALPGDDRAAREALAALQRMGAEAAARAFARERAAMGARALRGPRRSTLANAAGLTRREQEVLGRLATGATNAAIAAEMHLSQRTVAHHVSALLGKLGAANRTAAVERARARGLLGQDGPPADPT